MTPLFAELARRAFQQQPLSRGQLLAILRAEGGAHDDALYWANRIRRRFKRDDILSCSIISAKQGLCSEDCRFCSQAARYRTGISTHPLVPLSEIEKAADHAAQVGSHSLGIVVSGRGLTNEEEIARVVEAVRRIRAAGKVAACASLGVLDEDLARRLKDAGLCRYHHNLETSRRFFPHVCTTHSYEDRLRTLHVARRAGLDLCSGALFGLGETDEDRVDLARQLRDLEVRSVPLNFLNPIPGTPLADAPPLPPRKILRIIAMFRFALPAADIKVCGGREVNLRDLQSWMFYAGANGAMIGNYLTTAGRPAEEDCQMLRDLGLRLTTEA